MRTRSISTATALAVLFSSAALSVVAAGTASAATATVASPAGLVADGALKRVFVGDTTGGRILATDYAGTLVDSVSGLGTVSDLAVSDDGATLYAAVRDTHEIVALDAATLDVVRRYPVATDTGPTYVAFSAGKVWFTYGDQWDGDLGSVDPSVDPASGTDPVALTQFPTEGTGSGIHGQGLLDTDPTQPGVLAVGETGISTDSMAVLDVSGAAPSVVAWYDGDYTLNSGIGDIDLVPGGQEVLVNGAVRDAYADGKFHEAGSYPSGLRADIAPNGMVAQYTGSNVVTYEPNSSMVVHSYAQTTEVAALEWAPDLSRVFTLLASGSGYALKVLGDPTLNNPTLTVSAPTKATRAKQLTVTGRLSASVALPAGAQLAVTRTDLESPSGKALAAVTVKADGTYSFTDTPPAGGTVTYTVSYAGDATHSAVSASDKVEVSRTTPTLTLNKNGNVYSYGADVSFTAHLGSTYKNRTVEIWANPYGSDKPNTLIRTAKVNSSGNVSATVDMKRDTTVSAVFAGDARTAPRTVKVTAYARVKISNSISKHYKTGTIGSHSYYWFHKSTSPVVTTTMSYYKGRKERLELEVYYNGTWYDSGSEYFKLGTNGKVAVSLGAPGESGVKARVRTSYINNSSGDNVNSTTHSSWKYLYFTK
ncbi:Ig-like domain repeat protein [Streptomyces sp. VRA16 Mangrove soil]|uniref:Ig-like domain repeat protein n=1 Tax=Streptomyces sp. VRA16 Mangrove soil TaxID=2817434 RepID=UPI001A9D0B37|nr:Ig-like domain repeat protein [Streptomyces sp. VRA16 Mangrove soil]MBO1337453.1 Ig-like domain repeat protein [Streptomyces sp. VRA16 Mangrove soil]